MIPIIFFALTVIASDLIQVNSNFIPSLMFLSCNNDPRLLLEIRPDHPDSINTFDKALDILACYCLKTLSDYKGHGQASDELIELIQIENTSFNSLLRQKIWCAHAGKMFADTDNGFEFDLNSIGEILLGREDGIISLFVDHPDRPFTKMLLSKMLLRGSSRINRIISYLRLLKKIPNPTPLALLLLNCLFGQKLPIGSKFKAKYLAFFRQIELFVMRVTFVPLPENWFLDPIPTLNRLQFDPSEDLSYSINEEYMQMSLPDLILAPRSIPTAIFYLGVILFKYVSKQLNPRDLCTVYFFNPFSRHIRQDEFTNKFISFVIDDSLAQDKSMILKHLLDYLLSQSTQAFSEVNLRSRNFPLTASFQVMEALRCMHNAPFCTSPADVIIDLMRFSEFEPTLQTLFDKILSAPPTSATITTLLNIVITAAPHRSTQLVTNEKIDQVFLNNNEYLLKLKLLHPDSSQDILSRCEKESLLPPLSLSNHLNLFKLPTLITYSQNLTAECIFYSDYQFYLKLSYDDRPKTFISSEDFLVDDGSLLLFIKTETDVFSGRNRKMYLGDIIFVLNSSVLNSSHFLKILKYSSNGLIFKYLEYFQGYAFVIKSKV